MAFKIDRTLKVDTGDGRRGRVSRFVNTFALIFPTLLPQMREAEPGDSLLVCDPSDTRTANVNPQKDTAPFFSVGQYAAAILTGDPAKDDATRREMTAFLKAVANKAEKDYGLTDWSPETAIFHGSDLREMEVPNPAGNPWSDERDYILALLNKRKNNGNVVMPAVHTETAGSVPTQLPPSEQDTDH